MPNPLDGQDTIPFVKLLDPQLGGLRATHPAAPHFDEQLATLYGVNAALVAELKPYIVMLSNESDHKMIAYTLLVARVMNNGDVNEFPCFYSYPDAAGENEAMPRGREIFPGERRIVALDWWEIDPQARDLDFFLPQHVGFLKMVFPENVKGIEISLDAVLYKSGHMVGPDTHGLADRFVDSLRARRELYESLLDSPAPAQRLRSLFDQAHYHVYLKMTGGDGSQDLPQLGELLKRQSEISDTQRRCIEDTNRFLLNFGEQTLLEAMRGALRNEELAIHRKLP